MTANSYVLSVSNVGTIPSYAFSGGLLGFAFPYLQWQRLLTARTSVFFISMLISTALGMFLMTGILTAEMIIEGQKGGRLSWPYDDLVSGNYLSKVGLPAFAIMVALAIGAKPRLASIMGSLSLISIIMSIYWRTN